MKAHPLQIRPHINMLVNCMHPRRRLLPPRRESVDSVRQIPILDRVHIPLHDIPYQHHFLASSGGYVFEIRTDSAAEEMPDRLDMEMGEMGEGKRSLREVR